MVYSTKPTMAFSKEKALEALKELGELGDNIFPEVQKHDFLPVHKTAERLCFLYRYEKVVTAASDAKEIEIFYVAKKNVVDNILFEPMPCYSVNVVVDRSPQVGMKQVYREKQYITNLTRHQANAEVSVGHV